MGEEADDVRRVLTIVFRGTHHLSRPDLERTLSFDMEWIAPSESEDVVEALLGAGWLEEKEGEIHLAVSLGAVQVPFGWFPRPNRLLHPVSAQDNEAAHPPQPSVSTQEATVAAPTSTLRVESTTGDPRAGLLRRLVRYIQRQSGLDLEELERRAERKIKAFHHITPWLAYALVAREQGLEMDAIAEALAVV